MSLAVGGRSVIVTGGSRGIGYGIAHVFAEAGAHVTIVGRDPDVAAQLAARLIDCGASVDDLIADISKPSECARMAKAVMATR
jgi:3-oxoacyl-[acyl-carrier protein] reductase